MEKMRFKEVWFNSASGGGWLWMLQAADRSIDIVEKCKERRYEGMSVLMDHKSRCIDFAKLYGFVAYFEERDPQ